MVVQVRDIQSEIHRVAVEKGWWDDASMSIIPEKLALIHGEISEALECYRDPEEFEDYFSSSGKPEGFGFELADTIIRILDLAGFLGLDMDELVRTKHEYNKSRSYRHGGKRA